MPRMMIAASLMGLTVMTGSIVFRMARADDEDRPSATVQPQQDDALKEFMRQKLDASSKILEGLALEDPELIKEGAGILSELSGAEQWHVSMDPIYRQLSNEFHRTADKLVTAAGEMSIDRAARHWMDATMSCIKCHRYTRYALIAEDQKR